MEGKLGQWPSVHIASPVPFYLSAALKLARTHFIDNFGAIFKSMLLFLPSPPLFIDFSLRKRVKTCSNRSGSGFRLLKIVARQTLFWIILAIFFVPDRGRKNWEGKSGEKVNTGLFSLEDYCRGRRICLLFSFFTTDHPSQPRRNYSYVD